METTIMGYTGYILGLYWGNIGISGLGFKVLGFGFRGAPAHECYWGGDCLKTQSRNPATFSTALSQLTFSVGQKIDVLSQVSTLSALQ